jgi:hypothetical protein
VVATKNDSGPANFRVEGTITINNPNDFDVQFAVSDQLDDGTTAAVTCPTDTVPAFGSVGCTYIAYPPNADAMENTATITTSDPYVDGATTSDPIEWTENLTGDDVVGLTDPYAGVVEPILLEETTEVPVPEDFYCSADTGLYTDGYYSYEVVNTAFLDGDNTDLEASATVLVECTLEPLEVSKTADGSYDRTVEWTLEKVVDPASHSGFAGELAGSSVWTVTATKAETLDNYQVTGDISIYNPASIAQSFTVSDVLDDGTGATVTCPKDTVEPEETVVCDYEALP